MYKNIYPVFGVDGVGKTTTIKNVRKELERKGHKCSVYLMGRAGNHKIPFIKTVMRTKAKYLKKKKGLDPKKDALLVDIYRKRGFIFMSIYYLDLWLRFLEIKKLSRNGIILTDRFFYDGLALTKEKYLPFFRRITPRVKSFFLHAPPEVILKRKQEATSQNMMDYKKRVEKEFLGHFDISMVDTSKSLNSVVKGIVSEIKDENKIGKKVIEEFNKENVNYCILRNYDDIEDSDDIDILVDWRDGLRIKKILRKNGLLRRIWGLGPFWISNKRFDLKVGCMEYGRFFIEDSKSVLKRKIKYNGFYILGKEDELEHLILKSLGNGFSKDKYLRRIIDLFKECNVEKVKANFSKKYGFVGEDIFNFVKNRKYVEASKLKRAFFRNLKSPGKKLKYYLLRTAFPCMKR